jgi:hypothetical protein
MPKFFNLYKLAEVFARSPESMRKELKKNLLKIPPRLFISGTGFLQRRAENVDVTFAAWVIGGANG